MFCLLPKLLITFVSSRSMALSQGLTYTLQLNTIRWHKAALGDKTLLPLGLSPDDLS